MLKKNLINGILSAPIIMASCAIYHPQTADIPLISEKKELRVDAGISIVPSVNATISYGLTERIVLQTFGSIGSYERYYFQGAVGIFKKYENFKVMEIYGGFGRGYGNAYKDANPGDLFGHYQLYFLQLNYGKIECKFANMEYGFGLKAGYFHSNLTDQNYYHFYSETGPYTTYSDESFLIEPIIFMRLGGEKLKFNIKLGSCLFKKYMNTDKRIPYNKINFGIGLNYRF